MRQSSNNPEILQELITSVEHYQSELQALSSSIRTDLNAYSEIYSELIQVIADNQPINARNIAKYVEDVNNAADAIEPNDLLNVIESKLESADLALERLRDYYTNQYMVTVNENSRWEGE